VSLQDLGNPESSFAQNILEVRQCPLLARDAHHHQVQCRLMRCRGFAQERFDNQESAVGGHCPGEDLQESYALVVWVIVQALADVV